MFLRQSRIESTAALVHEQLDHSQTNSQASRPRRGCPVGELKHLGRRLGWQPFAVFRESLWQVGQTLLIQMERVNSQSVQHNSPWPSMADRERWSWCVGRPESAPGAHLRSVFCLLQAQEGGK